MDEYAISGMSCAACSARVEKAVSSLEGVTSCTVNLLTNSMTVSGNVSEQTVIAAVHSAGYGAIKQNNKKENKSKIEAEKTTEKTRLHLRNRLLISLFFLILLMYISMGHTMWSWPLPVRLSDNPLAIGLLQLLFSTVVLVINQRFFISGFRGIVHKAPNMDTLVSLGSGISYLYSVWEVFRMSDMVLRGEVTLAKHLLHGLYFESAAMILVLITLGKMLEARSKGKTTEALRELMDLSPQMATIIKDGAEVEVPIEQLRVGDMFVVRPGAAVPADGVVVSGHSAIDESALTGESIPVDKSEGDAVSAATINSSGVLFCRAVKVGEDTALSQIIRLVRDASASKAPIAKAADTVSGIFVPVVLLLALVTLVVWLCVGVPFGEALGHAIAVLVISCPCALGLATPVAIMVGNGVGARHGILFKTATSLEVTGKVKIVAMDKTGTITSGTPQVTDIVPAEGVTKSELLMLAASLEQHSEHPLASAIMRKARESETELQKITDFSVVAGNGLCGKLDTEEVYGGNLLFMQEKVGIGEAELGNYQTLAKQGKTPLFFGKNGLFYGMIAVADTMKEDSPRAIKALKKMGIRVVMLTGDNEQTAKRIAEEAGVCEVIAGVLPEGKEEAIRNLQSTGLVAMVGDGINDAPALARADVGIAIGTGTDVAVSSAEVVLMKNRLSDVVVAIRLSRATLRNIYENLFWAFLYNVIGIPLAAGVFVQAFGWSLTPMFGAAAMSVSSFCVVSNALRLNLFKTNFREKKERIGMKKTMLIEGMMCPHCEARVKQTLEALEQVEEAIVSHEKNQAEIILRNTISDAELISVIEAQGYKVTEVK